MLTVLLQFFIITLHTENSKHQKNDVVLYYSSTSPKCQLLQKYYHLSDFCRFLCDVAAN